MPWPIHNPNCRVVGVADAAAVKPFEMSWKLPRMLGLFGPVMKNALSFPSIAPSLKIVVAKADALRATHRSVRHRVAKRSFKVKPSGEHHAIKPPNLCC